jgi:hypothetical protein
LISINYEKLFIRNNHFFYSAAIGIGYRAEVYDNSSFLSGGGGSFLEVDNYLALPHHISMNYGWDHGFFEFGLGGTFVPIPVDLSYSFYVLYPFIGYRWQPTTLNKNNFRIFASIPFKGIYVNDYFFLPIGISSGICF